MTEQDNNDQQRESSTKTSEFTPITSQEEFDKRVGARLASERAKFSDLKAKAAKYDEAQEAAKSEQQKLEERARAAEQRAEMAEREALVADVAREKGVPKGSLTGNTREELMEAADGLLSWREEAARSNSLNPRGGFFSGASPKGEPALSDKQRAAAAVRQMRADN